jgi:hypothetical protein
MTSHFIITSAIYTSYGKCSTEERIEQTRETFWSGGINILRSKKRYCHILNHVFA